MRALIVVVLLAVASAAAPATASAPNVALLSPEGNRLHAYDVRTGVKQRQLKPTYLGEPDNYGCGFLDGSHLVTTSIGNPLPQEEPNGELLLWFGPFDARRARFSSRASLPTGWR